MPALVVLQLEGMLSPFGELKDCVVIVEKMTQKSKVVGWGVTGASNDLADYIHHMLHGGQLGCIFNRTRCTLAAVSACMRAGQVHMPVAATKAQPQPGLLMGCKRCFN